MLKVGIGVFWVSMLLAFYGRPAPAGDLVFVVGSDGAVSTLDADAGLRTIASSREFGVADRIVALNTGNIAVADRTNSNVWVCDPLFHPISFHHYKLMEKLVDLWPMDGGQFLVAGLLHVGLVSEGQEGVTTQRNMFRSTESAASPTSADTACRVRGVAGINAKGEKLVAVSLWVTEPSNNPTNGKPVVRFGKAVATKLKMGANDVCRDMPGASTIVPLPNGTWLIAGGGEMSLRTWEEGFPKKSFVAGVGEVSAAVAFPDSRVAVVNTLGQISVWATDNAALTPVVGPTSIGGRVVSMQVMTDGRLAVAFASGRVVLFRVVASDNGHPGRLGPALLERSDLGTLVDMAVGPVPAAPAAN